MLNHLPINPRSPMREECSLWDEQTDTYYMLYLLGMTAAAKENRRQSAPYIEAELPQSYTEKDFHVINYLQYAARKTKREIEQQPKFGGNEIKDLVLAIEKLNYLINIGLNKEKLTETKNNLIKQLKLCQNTY